MSSLMRTFISDILAKEAQACGGNDSVFSQDICKQFADTLCGFPKVGQSCQESFKYEPEMIPVFRSVDENTENSEEFYVELDMVSKLADSKQCKIHEAFYMMQNYIAKETQDESAADRTFLVVAGLNEAKNLVQECKLAEGSSLQEIKYNALSVTTSILEDLRDRGVNIKIKN